VYDHDFEEVKRLVDAGADVNSIDGSGETLLYLALRLHYDRAQKAGPLGKPARFFEDEPGFGDEDEGVAYFPKSEFEEKCAKENIFKFLVEKADPNVRSKCTWKSLDVELPLSLCVLHNDVELIEILLKRGANPTLKDSNEKTLLHLCAPNNMELVKKLVTEYGIDVNAKDGDGRTPLYSFMRGTVTLQDEEIPEKIVEFLMSKGADINVVDNKGKTLLHAATDTDNDRMIRFLIEKVGIKVDPKKGWEKNGWDEGNTPLHMFARIGDVGFARKLIDYGFEVNKPGVAGYTPLHRAVHYYNYDMVKFLVEEAKADVNIVTDCRKTEGADLKETPYALALDSLEYLKNNSRDDDDERDYEKIFKIVNYLANHCKK
jgi:ankyrin repeat protein